MVQNPVRRASLLLLVVAVLVGLGGAPASAQTKLRQDPVGDAPSFIDITSVKVQNNARKLAVTTRFDTVRGRTQTFVAFERDRVEGEPDFYSVFSTRVGKDRYRTRLSVIRAATGEAEFVDCPGLRGTWRRGARGWNRVVVPQTCLGTGAGRLRVTVVGVDAQDEEGFLFAFRRGLRGDEQPNVDQLDSTVTVRRGA